MNIVYNASAGTGKTWQVTRLYEKLVLKDGIDPRSILLMTFTDNAAAELRMRVAHRLLKVRRTAEAEGDDTRVETAIAAMSRLPSAPIGTIHSFCTRLLREHALEAGLSPGFSVLGEDDRRELLDQICRDEMLAQLAASEAQIISEGNRVKPVSIDADFKTFCSGAHMIGTGSGFDTSITETVPRLIGEAGSLGISLENTEAMLPQPSPPVSIAEFQSIHQQLENLPKRSNKVEEALQILGRCLEQTDNPLELIDLFNQSFSGHFSYGDAKTIYPLFKELREEAISREQYRERFPAAKAFARYVQSVHQKFQQRKHAMDAVDFDDQLRMAAELLKTGKAKPGFDYVIVDEVQDTSRIQCDLIRSLWGEETHLVICGDKKQSIYTWRGADPQVMPDLEKEILAANGNLENLQTSYRSKAPILNVVNKLFESAYGPDDYADGDSLQPNPDFETADEKPCIEFLEADCDDDLPKQEKVAAEMEAVVNRIQLLVDGSKEWQPTFRYSDSECFEPTGKGNHYRYSDILILLRRTTHQSVLEQALRHAGIRYTLAGKGRGLFTRQETRDVSLFLNVITNPKDAYSLIGFLRSPWVGISDEAIAEMAWSEKGFSAENIMERHAEATDVIDRYRQLLGTKLASELVRMLIDETGYDALLAGLPRGTQRLANLRKVIDWLREHERGAQTTPAAVARKLAEQIKSPPQIPEAALLDPAENAVTIMTVHGAKGLTKRVVFLPDTSSSLNSDKSFARVFFDEQKNPTLGIKITAPDKSGVESPGLKRAKAHAKSVRDHELKNLFYVAMTRARDLVVTSATVGKKPSGWLKKLEPLLDAEIPSTPYSTLREAVKVSEKPPKKILTADQLAGMLESRLPPPAPPTLRRIPVTQLAKETEPGTVQTKRSARNAAALGSLGHAVLERLALNEWEASVGKWLGLLCDEFGVTKAEASALEERIEHTRGLMRTLTSGMHSIRPELRFVLHDDDLLIDGTIDLLCHGEEGVFLFDYKFTEADDGAVTEAYREQMAIYSKAVAKAFPGEVIPAISLIVVSEKGARTVPIALP